MRSTVKKRLANASLFLLAAFAMAGTAHAQVQRYF